MVNPGVIILIILAVIIVLIITGLVIWGGVTSSAAIAASSQVPITTPCASTVNVGALPQITSTSKPCIQQGLATSLYYINESNYVAAPWTSSPLDVCVGFCTSYANNICTGPDYNGKSAQDNYNNCISQLSSTTCVPPTPIAAKGTILYYPLSPGCGICDNYDPTTCVAQS